MSLDFDKHLEDQPKTTKPKGKGGIRIVKKTEAEGVTETEKTETVEAPAGVAEVKTTKKRATKPRTTKAKAQETTQKEEAGVDQALVEKSFEEVLDVKEPNTDNDSTDEVLRDQAASEGVDYETGLPFWLDPSAIAVVGLSGSRTLNLGNYESAKIEVFIQLPVPVSNLEAGHKFCTEWVEAKLNEAIGGGGAKEIPKEIPTKVHGSDEEAVAPKTTKKATPAKPATVVKQETKPADKPKVDEKKVDASGDKQQGDVSSTGNYEEGSIYDPNADYDEDL